MNDRERAGFRRSHPGGEVDPYMASPGDTLAGIAKSNHVDVNALARANKLKPNATIKPGDILAIPKASVSGSPELNRITKNDYSFGIDPENRTREVKGDLHFAKTIKRSKTSPKEAGGADRRSADDGGHFIAARFDGPTAAFNHFAQDTSFNRGGYRAIEDSWAKELRSGKQVSVDIKAYYVGNSRQPASLFVVWKTNGAQRFRRFANEPKVKTMSDDRYIRLGPALTNVGQEAVRIVGGNPDYIYLYVEIGDNWVDTSLFRDEGSALRWFDPDEGLNCALITAWDLEPEDKRWTGMEYTIDNGKFDAKFQFDDLDAYEGSDERRQKFLHARFGDKPQLYPPMGGGWDLTPPL